MEFFWRDMHFAISSDSKVDIKGAIAVKSLKSTQNARTCQSDRFANEIAL